MGRPESPLVGLQRCQQSSTFQEANDRKMQMYQVSIGRIMLTLGLLVFISILGSDTASVIVGCPTFRYMLNGTCYPCPDNCRICVSDTNCSLCTRGFFGPVCENRCGETCTGTCHKVFGHCTQGCPDGDYPGEHSGCLPCPHHCYICESNSKCVLCEDGHFGINCQGICSEDCFKCNKTTGQCIQCKETYFGLNGVCKSCLPGCSLCVSFNSCIQCKDSYFKHGALCRSCPHGCQICNNSDNCQACADGFRGPVDGRCLYKCPANRVITYTVPYEDGRCGIWQDTDTNICHLQSESYICTSSGNCLLDTRCPYTFRCMDEKYSHAPCATVKQYECKHTCKQLHNVYGCVSSCSVQAENNGPNNILCMTDTGSIDLQTQDNTAKAYCSKKQVTPTDTTDTLWTTKFAVLVVFIIVLGIITIVLSTLLAFRKRCCTLLMTITRKRLLTMKKKSRRAQSKKDRLSDPETLRGFNVSVTEDVDVLELNVDTRHRKPPEDAEETQVIDKVLPVEETIYR